MKASAVLFFFFSACLPALSTIDQDDDGFSFVEDCDDENSEVNSGAIEICDGLDNDCDNRVDEDDAVDAAIWFVDVDADGFGATAATWMACHQPEGYSDNGNDCDDTNVAVNPDAIEVCGNDLDEDCSGGDLACTDADEDDDGYSINEGDCNDADSSINPKAIEVCDDTDNDCDDTIDEDDAVDAVTWYRDADSDGFGNPTETSVACDAPENYVADKTDCDDANSSIFPDADELCDGDDNDCDKSIDEEAIDPTTWYRDFDSDNYGNSSETSAACEAPVGYVLDSTDCDDANITNHPGASEYCDGEDNDCDDAIDEDSAVDVTVWYRDIDNDGYGTNAYTISSCECPTGYVADSTDCNDGSRTTHPDAAEICDDFDNDCDDSVDEDFDLDDDGWTTCEGDCDDADLSINPEATEICDDTDNDCDDVIDEDDAADATTWYLDADSDGYGDILEALVSCESPEAHIADNTDCDDSNPLINPAITEEYSEYGNGVDEDCNGVDDIMFLLDEGTFCITAKVFSGCYVEADAYLYGDTPFGSWFRLATDGYMILGARVEGFYCFDFHAEYPDTPRIYEFFLVSAKSVTDATCSTAVNLDSSSDWQHADGIDDYCETGADPYNFCDSDSHYSGRTLCVFDTVASLESCH